MKKDGFIISVSFETGIDDWMRLIVHADKGVKVVCFPESLMLYQMLLGDFSLDLTSNYTRRAVYELVTYNYVYINTENKICAGVTHELSYIRDANSELLELLSTVLTKDFKEYHKAIRTMSEENRKNGKCNRY